MRSSTTSFGSGRTSTTSGLC